MANLYNPESLGIKAPSGGFQQGAWYSGRQYWGGQLSDPGVINPLSNQQGAGQAVSAEVNQQTSVAAGLAPNANQDYINKLNAQPQPTPVSTVAPRGASPSTSSGGAGTGAGIGLGSIVAPTINLPELYKSLYKDSGIEATQADLSAKEKGYNDALSKINDNPYLSEATRVGRVQKLSTDYQNSIASLKNDVTTKKADIEMKLNLESKQFDINSDQAKTAFSQFNSLLEMGALDNASGDEIAAITMTTGLPS